VINVITKTAEETQGSLLVAGTGTQESAFSSFRHGGETKIGGNKGHYRAYGKFNTRHENINLDRSDGPDDSKMGRAGFRLDWDSFDSDAFTVQGDAYVGDQGFGYTGLTSLTDEDDYDLAGEDDWDVSGGNLLGRWTRDFSETDSLTLQTYYDRTDRDSELLGIERDTVDLDLQHRFEWAPQHTLTWGLGYRLSMDEMDNKAQFLFDPDDTTDHLFSGFLQNEMSLLDDKLRLTLGSKVEHNDYTGWELQPSVRSAYIISENQSVWAAVSRAVQTRSRVDDMALTRLGAIGPDAPPFFVQVNGLVLGNDSRDAQRVYAFELGYRVRPIESVSLDFAFYQNEYKRLVDIDGIVADPIFVPGIPPDYIMQPAAIFGNNIEGHIRGAELAANWQAMDGWRLGSGYAYTHGNFKDTTGGGVGLEEEGYPRHQYHVRSYYELTDNLQLDGALYYVDSVLEGDVSSYYRLDLRLGWTVSENTELSLVGQNLLENSHQEWQKELDLFEPTKPRRAVYGKVTWNF
jgi:iron complex outermembrane receptor protein